jgi:hypothetical protein
MRKRGLVQSLEESMRSHFAYVQDFSTGSELKIMFYGDTCLYVGTVV